MMPLAVGKLTAINGKPIDSIALRRRTREGLGRSPAAPVMGQRAAAGQPDRRRPVAGCTSPRRPRCRSTRCGATCSLKLGDTLSFNVGEGSLDAKPAASARSTGVRSGSTFSCCSIPPRQQLPHTWLASFYLPRGMPNQLAQLSRDYSNLSLIDVDSLLDRVREIVDRVGNAVRWILGFSLLAGALVLPPRSRPAPPNAARSRPATHARRASQSTACGRRLRIRPARPGRRPHRSARCRRCGLWLGHAVFHIDGFVPPLWPLALGALSAAIVVMLLGLAGTRKVTQTSPMRLLREG
jgi:putative ABC transport system permease protein